MCVWRGYPGRKRRVESRDMAGVQTLCQTGITIIDTASRTTSLLFYVGGTHHMSVHTLRTWRYATSVCLYQLPPIPTYPWTLKHPISHHTAQLLPTCTWMDGPLPLPLPLALPLPSPRHALDRRPVSRLCSLMKLHCTALLNIVRTKQEHWSQRLAPPQGQ